MLATIAWRNVRTKPVRFLGTVLAVVLATLFLSAALTARDSLEDSLVTSAEAALDDVDLAVRPPSDDDQEAAGGQGSGPSASPSASEEAGGGVTIEFGAPDDGRVPVAVTDQVAAVAGVADVLGEASGFVELPPPPGAADQEQPSVFGGDGQATGWVVAESSLLPWDVDEGRLPSASGEVALDRDSIAARDLAIGDAFTLATSTGPLDVTLVGVTSYGESAARSGADVLFGRHDAEVVAAVESQGWNQVLVDVADDADPAAVADDIAAAVADVDVVTGEQLRDDAAGEAAGLASGLGIGLQVFAYLALVVGALIIFNTFTTIVAQRTRDFALLRTIGTSAGQVLRAVLVEAILVGLGASVVGCLVGVALIAVAIAVVPAIGNFATFAVSPWSLVQVVASGLVVTVVAAVVPAWRASRTPPVEAMRDADPTIKPVSRVRSAIGLVLLALGAVAVGVGSATSNWWAMGAGALALFVGVLVAGPIVVAGLARALRGPLSRLSIGGELAVAEAARNSRRTAATANALVIGVFLVVFATAAGGALRDYAIEQIQQFAGADLSVSTFTGEPIPQVAIDDIVAVEGLADVVELNPTVGIFDLGGGFGGGQVPVAAGDLERLDVLGLEMIEGAADPDGIVLAEQVATQAGLAIGDTVTVELVDSLAFEPIGVSRDYDVVGFTGFSFDLPPLVVDTATVREATGEDVPVLSLAATFDAGADQDEVRTAVTEVTGDYAGVEVIDANLFVTLLRTFFNFLLSAVAALLGVAVVIALFGILNTLVLAIVQRTRELGVLRAVGMRRRQVRQMVRVEAVVTSLVGTVVGAALGLGLAFAVIRVALEGSFTWPWAELAITLVLGVVTGVLASVVPARLAARLDPLEAIRTE